MTPPALTITVLREVGPDAPLLVVGPSLGTSVEQLWSACAQQIGTDVTVLGWDLPGHGRSAPAAGFDIADLVAALIEALDGAQEQLAAKGINRPSSFAYAGDSLGGAVGLQLLLEHPDRVRTAVLCCTGAKLGTTEGWQDRARLVRAEGTASLLPLTPGRWFAPGFRESDTARTMLATLAEVDQNSYAAACEALGRFDVRDRLARIRTPVLAVAGADDVVAPVAGLRQIAGGVQHGRLVVLENVAHLAPVEAPERVAELISNQLAHLASAPPAPITTAEVRADGMRVRREVLGDAHVDRASAAATELTAEFQEFITAYAWGSIWTRPGLDRRSRSMITLTALIARGHQEELAMHLRAALTNGVTREEIKEVILQSAIYCGVPDANTAFRVAQQTFAQLDDDQQPRSDS